MKKLKVVCAAALAVVLNVTAEDVVHSFGLSLTISDGCKVVIDRKSSTKETVDGIDTSSTDYHKVILVGNAVKDFDFDSNKDVQILVIKKTSINDLAFLDKLNDLDVLVFDDVRISGNFDLSRYPCLEYFEWSNSNLRSFNLPDIIPPNLKYVVLSDNKLTEVGNIGNIDESMVKVCLYHNPLEKNFKSIYGRKYNETKDIYSTLPDKYQYKD